MSCVVWLCRVRNGRAHVHDSARSHAGCSITHDDYVWAEISGWDSRGTADQCGPQVGHLLGCVHIKGCTKYNMLWLVWVRCICTGSQAESECRVFMPTITVLLHSSSAVFCSQALSDELCIRSRAHHNVLSGSAYWLQGVLLQNQCVVHVRSPADSLTMGSDNRYWLCRMCHSVNLQYSSDWHAFWA